MMEREKKESFAKRLEIALAIRNMKQADLCASTKIPKSAMSQYKKGSFEPKQDRIFLIAKALKVSEAWLMGYDVPMETKSECSNESTINHCVGINIFNRRKNLGLTLQQVANIVGVGKSTVRKWENGMIANMKIDKIEVLAKALDTTTEQLMGLEKESTTCRDVLDDRERKLINAFRQVPEEMQNLVLDMLKFFNNHK